MLPWEPPGQGENLAWGRFSPVLPLSALDGPEFHDPRGDPGGCTNQPTPASNLARSRCLEDSLAGAGAWRGGTCGPRLGTRPACFSYLGLRLDMDGPDRAPGR